MKTTLRLIAAACLYVTTAFAQNQLTANLTVTNQEIVGAAAGSIPVTVFEVDSTSTSSPRGIMSAQFNTGTDGARFHGRKARGTRAAPTTVVTGDNLTRWVGSGYDGSNFLEDASIIFGTEGTVAATRIPTNIQFWTATNAAPSVLTLAGQFNSSQQLLLSSGTAAAPSWSWTSAPTNGLYYVGSNQIGVSNNGVQSLIFASGGTIYGATSNNLILAANGSITVNAAGTNQSITLTPSGTGLVVTPNTFGFAVQNSSAASVFKMTMDASNNMSIGNGGNTGNTPFYVQSGGTGALLLQTQGAAPITFSLTGVEKARFATTTGNLLLGGLTTDGTGVLQFPAGAGTSASGIGFSTDTFLYRGDSTHVYLSSTGAVRSLNLLNSASISSGLKIEQSSSTSTIGNTESGSTVLISANTAALTLDSSQNATFAGTVTATDIKAAAGSILGWTGTRSRMTSGADGVIMLANNAGTDFARLQFGGTTSSFPAIKRSSATLLFRLADDSSNADIQAQGGTFTGEVFGSGAGFRTNGGYVVNAANQAVLDYSSGARLIGFGADASTNGIFSIQSKRSDGSNTLTFLSFDSAGAATLLKTVTSYNGIATAGNGVVTVQGAARATAQTGANASVATYTVGASDASFEVSANILVTTATTHAFTCTCAYTDEGNTARTITFTFSNVGGTFLTSIANTGGAVPYEGVPLHIRAKASTAITIATTGTFTSVVYNVEGVIRKLQ